MRWLNRKPRRGAKKTRRNPRARRRRTAPRWLRPALRAALMVTVIAVVTGGPYWLWRSGWIAEAISNGHRMMIAWSADIGLTVQEVTLEGRIHSSRRRIETIVGLKRGDPLYGFDPEDIRARLAALPWVRTATVQRQIPGTVRIHIAERLPMALWQRKGKLMLVDDEGKVITRRKLKRFSDLLIVIGDDAPRHAANLIAMLGDEPELARRVNAAVRVGKRRLNLELKVGIKVRLPETDAGKSWRMLARLERRHRLLGPQV